MSNTYIGWYSRKKRGDDSQNGQQVKWLRQQRRLPAE